MAGTPGTIRFPQVNATPSPPPAGYILLYTKTDDVMYIQDSTGTEIPLGSSSAITVLTGDVSASGPGSAVATVNFVGGASAASVAASVTAFLAATPTDNPNTIVERDSSGNFAAGTITANLLGSSTSFTGSLVGDVTGTQGATSIASTVVTGKLLTGYTSGTNTPILSTDSILIAFEKLQAQVSGTSGTAITALTGDVSATGPGSAVATVNSVGGSSAANIHSAELLANAATALNTASTIVFRDASGNFAAGTITANLTGNVTGNLTGNVTGNLTGNVTGNVSGSSSSFTGSLAGDVTGTQGATVVSLVGGQTASAVAAATVTVDAATSLNNASTLVERDASGNFAASTITASLVGNVTGNVSGSAASFTGSLAGDVTGTQGATSIASTVVTGKLLTGLVAGTNTPIIATNSILIAFENLQAQISTTSGAAITALTGDVSATGPGSVAATIQPNVVSNSKLAQMAANTLKGNNTGSTANAADLTTSQVAAMLGYVVSIGAIDSQPASANGLVINTNILYAQSASVTVPGMVNVTTQSFAGNKTFTGAVAISTASTTALTLNSTAFVFDSINNALGIGIQPATTVMVDGVNTTGASKLVQMTGYGVGSTTGYRGRFARGTIGSPTAVQTGDILSAISGRGYGASQFAVASTGVINMVAGENFTNTSNLTYLQFSATPTGSVTSAESMRVATTGVTLGPQTGSTAIHQINGGESNTTNTIIASTYAVDSVTTDYIIYTDSTSNTITITLPAPTNGRTLLIEDKTGKASTNSITVNPHASEKINGASNIVISQPYGNVRLTSDGTNWFANTVAPSIYVPAVVALTESGGVTTINWAAGNMFTLTLNANLTVSFSNQVAGQTIVVRLTNTASNYTVTWPTVKWAVQTTPVMTTGAFSDVYTFIYDGSNTYGSYVQNF